MPGSAMPGGAEAADMTVRFGRGPFGLLLAAAIALASIPLGSTHAAPQRRASEFQLANGMQAHADETDESCADAGVGSGNSSAARRP